MYIENRKIFVNSWRERAEKNYYKSLDHKSIMFKQNEKKGFNSKNYMVELKNIHSLANSQKNKFMLKGGSTKCEFYSSFAPLE